MDGLLRVLANAVSFFILYALFMVPTYVLPYLGSNSGLVNALASRNPFFWIHLISLLALCTLGLARGAVIGRKWLVIFPALATLFDLTPFLNFIPLVPTAMHCLCVVLGVALRKIDAHAGSRPKSSHLSDEASTSQLAVHEEAVEDEQRGSPSHDEPVEDAIATTIQPNDGVPATKHERVEVQAEAVRQPAVRQTAATKPLRTVSPQVRQKSSNKPQPQGQQQPLVIWIAAAAMLGLAAGASVYIFHLHNVAKEQSAAIASLNSTIGKNKSDYEGLSAEKVKLEKENEELLLQAKTDTETIVKLESQVSQQAQGFAPDSALLERNRALENEVRARSQALLQMTLLKKKAERQSEELGRASTESAVLRQSLEQAKRELAQLKAAQTSQTVSGAGVTAQESILNAAAQPKVKSYISLSNVDLVGADISVLKGIDLSSCRDACTRANECRATVFDRWNKVCFLKSEASALRLEPRATTHLVVGVPKPRYLTSPVKIYRYRKKAFPGPAYSELQAADYDNCQSLCVGDTKCVAFSYKSTLSLCQLFDLPEGYFTDSQVDSGVKTQDSN